MTLRRVFLYTALAVSLAVGAGDALAAAGGGGSSGSRGSRTYSAPSATPTAPRSAAPMERSVAPHTSTNPGSAAATRSPGGGFFSSGLGRGLIGGFLGAGLFGMLFGNGLFGGLGGIMSILGLIAQVAIVFLLVRFAIGFFRRKQPQLAGGQAGNGMQSNFDAAGPAAAFRQAGGSGGGQAAQQRPVEITRDDFDAFENRLGGVQAAYSNEDFGALRGMTTPEMASYFEQDLSNNQQRGQVNRVADVQLLKGDLAESWSEPDGEYATVAMRFSMRDAMVDIATGKVLSGSLDKPRETTELWTFKRPHGAPANAWRLSAIQQAR